MYQELSKAFSKEEVFQAIKDMKALAAPGPDGLPAIFYHTHWEVIGKEVTDMVLNILNNNGDPSHLNTTHICLIPKIKNPNSPSDFRPISLCNVTLKIITKTIANRIKSILPEVISPNQSAFIQGRLITDNTLIASEIFHYLDQTKRKSTLLLPQRFFTTLTKPKENLVMWALKLIWQRLMIGWNGSFSGQP
ncbi:ribonuclease H [Trifolium pratense]|uniref:Ribonuclease H n=1 Tax=Trifolium pratense TaxID=57577 RepID=A0A2K3KSH9_TRIPR|nr:ribonuclease H [Trifolium pratense]